MKLLLLIPAVRPGGAERVMTILANAWAQRGHEVTLATILQGEDFYEIDPRVRRAKLDSGKEARCILARGRALRFPIGSAATFLRIQRSIRSLMKTDRPDVAVSFLNKLNVRTLLAARGTDIPVIVSERIAPEKTSADLCWKILRRVLYPRAALLIAQTEREARWFASFVKRIAMIPNPVRESAFASGRFPRAADAPFLILGMGRLSRQKGFDILIEAFAEARKKHPNCELRIYGEGPERPVLEALIEKLGLRGTAELPGTTEDPSRAFAEADLFVLPSRHEGFPNVLAEAMAAGIPVTAADCPNGPREILSPEGSGILVEAPSARSFAEAIADLISDPEKRKRMGTTGARSVRERYSLESVLALWDSALDSARAVSAAKDGIAP